MRCSVSVKMRAKKRLKLLIENWYKNTIPIGIQNVYASGEDDLTPLDVANTEEKKIILREAMQNAQQSG